MKHGCVTYNVECFFFKVDNVTKQEKGNYYDSQKEQNIIEPKIGSSCCFSHYYAEMALAILHVYCALILR